MKTPKLLPWLARKAGRKEQDVEQLWRSAVRQASLRQPQLTSDQRMAVAMQELLARLGRGKNAADDTPLLAHKEVAVVAGAGSCWN